MKIKNRLTTGIVIGICIGVLPMVLTATNNIKAENEVGTYQISTTNCVYGTNDRRWICETTFDTRTGEIIKMERRPSSQYRVPKGEE